MLPSRMRMLLCSYILSPQPNLHEELNDLCERKFAYKNNLQDHHPPRQQTQSTPRTNHLPDHSAPFRRTSTRRWGAADCLRVHRLNTGLAADTNVG